MVHPRSAFLALCAVGLAFASACGGRALDTGDTHPSDAGAPPDAQSDAIAPGPLPGGPLGPECPSSIPASGAACAYDGRSCEYGADPDKDCNTIATCWTTGWSLATPGPHCPSPPPSRGPECPASRASIRPGAACSAVGLDCTYPEGRCGCIVDEGGPDFPDAAPPSPQWSCENPPGPKCPPERPRIGATCVGDESCVYGVCGLPGRILVTCVFGYWGYSGDVCGSSKASASSTR